MSKLALVWFLVAGLVGMVGTFEHTADTRPFVYGRSLAWAIVALMSLLGLVGVITL